MESKELARRIRSRLQEAFGDRLHGVVLYGSEARGDTRQDSDVDVLMLLQGPIRLGRDIDLGIQALYPLIRQIERPIQPLPVDVRRYEAGAVGLYRTAAEEGILA